MSHVYVAYRQEDAAFVVDLIQQIEDAGFPVWPDHARFRAGEHWREAIDQALRDAFAVLVVYTPGTEHSIQMRYEWAFALGANVTVIPVLRGEVTLPPQLSRLPLIRFEADKTPPWGRLLRGIQTAHEQQRTPASRFGLRRPSENANAFPPQRDEARNSPLLDRIRRDANLAPAPADTKMERPQDIPLDAPDAIPRLAKVLEAATNRELRVAVAQRLGETHSKAAVPVLGKLLREGDWRVRDASATALAQIKSANAVVALLEGLRSLRQGPFGGGMGVSQSVIDALRTIGTIGVPVLLDALSDGDPRIRLHVTAALSEFSDEEVVPGLLLALHDPEWTVRLRAAEGLGDQRRHEAIADLVNLLRDSNSEVRMAAAGALGQIGDAAAVPGLMRLLQDREWRLRWAAAEALYSIGTAAIPALIAMLDDENDAVQRVAEQTLIEIGEPAIEPLLELLQHAGWDTRWLAAETLAGIGAPAVDSLITVLTDSEWQTGWLAVETLKRIDTPEAAAAVQLWRGDETRESTPDEDGA